MKKANRNTRCGFTIIEVLVVITIIALIAGVGGGFYIGTYKRMLVEKAARERDNLMPPIIAAVKVYATVGEICDRLRKVFGEHEPTAIL